MLGMPKPSTNTQICSACLVPSDGKVSKCLDLCEQKLSQQKSGMLLDPYQSSFFPELQSRRKTTSYCLSNFRIKGQVPSRSTIAGCGYLWFRRTEVLGDYGMRLLIQHRKFSLRGEWLRSEKWGSALVSTNSALFSLHE